MKTIHIELSDSSVIAVVTVSLCSLFLGIAALCAGTERAAIAAGLVEQQKAGTTSTYWTKPASK